jgi:hypothetical protein
MWRLLVGYAIGTLQVLTLDWVRRRTSHRRDVLSLRAELRRIAELKSRYGWDEHGPKTDNIPNPPKPLPIYLETIGRTDFYLTDEHDDDNTQQVLLEVINGCEVLKHYWDRVDHYFDELQHTTDPGAKAKLRERALAAAGAYDTALDRVQFQIRDAIRDLERRLSESSLWRQANRPLGRLPPGNNPPALKPGDPRLKNPPVEP